MTFVYDDHFQTHTHAHKHIHTHEHTHIATIPLIFIRVVSIVTLTVQLASYRFKVHSKLYTTDCTIMGSNFTTKNINSS